jgi:WS/DGAT/MGAT family acyltransferase
MKPLSNLDSLFLDLDTKNTPMHIGSLALYDQSRAPAGKIRYKEILTFFQSRMSQAQCFRRRLIKVPFNLGNPYWLEDPQFDVEFHIRHIALPKPGDWRQLSILVARLFSRPMDMSKPLWEVYVIEGLDKIQGLPKGCFALLYKVHHSSIDGVSGAEILAATHDLSPEAHKTSQPDNWEAEAFPSELGMYLRGLKQQCSIPLRYGRYIKNFTMPLLKASRWFWQGKHHIHNAPLTRFNDTLSPHRIFEGISFELMAIKAIKNAVPGTTVNDVILSICGGALNKYLSKHNELPEESLLAMMPKSIRPDKHQKSEGNQISILRVATGSHIDKPIERLKFVAHATADAKELLAILGDDIVAETLSLFSPIAAKITGSAMMLSSLSKSLRLFNTVITNVPGPGMPLYFMGCEMINIFGMGPPAGGLGLFQVIFSYNGKITIGVTACREMMPDPAFYAECLDSAYEELNDAIAQHN